MRRLVLNRERGSAMVIVLTVMTVLTGMGAVVFNVAGNNLQNAGRDRLAGGAMGAAEAGVAQAIAHIQANGTSLLTCDSASTASPFCSNDWGYNYPSAGAGGHQVSLDTGRQYKVWIQRLQAYAPSSGINEGKYRIYSVGTAGSGPGTRSLTTDVTVEPLDFPLGIFAKDYVRNAGNTTIRKESLFSDGCIGKRDKITFDTTVNDLAHPGLVPGAHSTQYISTSNILNLLDSGCTSANNKNIHFPSSPGPCNSTYRYDRDKQGGSLTSTSCVGVFSSPPGSFFDDAALRSYGYTEPRGLPANHYAELKAKAAQQGNYYDCIAGTPAGACSAQGDLTNMTPLNGGTTPNAVLYARLAPGKTFTLSPSLLTGYGEAQCGLRSLLIVVEGGDLHLNNNLDMVAAIFVPDGTTHVNGGANIVGTLFAQELFMNGNATFTLKGQCFFDNLPGGVLKVTPLNFRELDR